MKLVIIDHEPYKTFKRDRYYFDLFIKEGYILEYWCVYNALKYTGGMLLNESNDSPLGKEHIINYTDYKVLLKDIDALDPKNTIICLEVWFQWSTFSLFNKLKKKNFQVFAIDYFINHPALTFVSRSNRFFNFLKQFELKTIFVRLLKLVEYKVLLLFRSFFNPISKIFISGGAFSSYYPGIKKKSISHFDLFLYQQSLSASRTVDGKYIVFLDDYLPHHPDISRSGFRSISPEIYYKKLNQAFSKIEKESGCKIVIAAHPKANYVNEFEGRMILTGKTGELVKNCEMVIVHASGSINFAVLTDKKILLIYTNEFINNNSFLELVFEYMKSFKQLLQLEMVNIDTNFSFSTNGIDKEAYEKYKQDYIYSKEYPKTNFEIIKDCL